MSTSLKEGIEYNDIIILKEGYSRFETSNVQRACGTSTLIKTADKRYIIVDTLGPWERDELISLLHHKANITPEQISMVIGTHNHVDHIGNLNLFTKSNLMIIGNNKINADCYESAFEAKGTYMLTPDIELWQTPGHTADDVSLIVRNVSNFGTVAIAGDLFEKEEDCLDESIWINAGSENIDEQRKNRNLIMANVDYIIPGHGGIFKADKAQLRQE